MSDTNSSSIPLLTPAEETKLSKLLSYILRHGAVKQKLDISSDGYVCVDDILAQPKFKHVTFEQIKYVVDHSDKKRYELSQSTTGVWLVRATQGHSLKLIQPENLLEQITGPIDTPVIHGTTRDAWEQIQHQGLSKMTRNHIHFAVGLPDDPHVKSGIRATSQVFIYVDVDKAQQDGIGGMIAPLYFKQVVFKE
ncbi:hypothetical protein [Parasitella parasitica]|uniref:2'-phosphotransferase n=1 Tax=Parasitella parasitica TaxID=35722 RepID=A0A0B7NCB2_9FUNG|nr:hypothetical protein [Parasitella parasitica]